MKGELLKRLMAKLGDIKQAGSARKMAKGLGGDETAGAAFKTGQGIGGRTPGGKPFGGPSSGLDDMPGAQNFAGPSSGPLSDPITMRPFSNAEMLKRKLAQMTPEQRAMLMGGAGGLGAGLGAGGLGGYMMGDDE
jgi:hypothetical protein